MKYLLDTNMLLLAALDQIPKKAVPFFIEYNNEFIFSSASIWEVTIKSGKPRSNFNINPTSFYKNLLLAGYEELSISSRHTLMVPTLPNIHNDPFDRILIAQSIYEGLKLLTCGAVFLQYPCDTVYIRK